MSVSTESLQDRRSMLSANALRTPAVSLSGSLAELSVVGASPAAHTQIRNPRRFKPVLRKRDAAACKFQDKTGNFLHGEGKKRACWKDPALLAHEKE